MKKIVSFAVLTASVFLLVGCSTEKEQKREASISQSSSEKEKKLEIICFKTFETDELGKAIITGTTEPDAVVPSKIKRNLLMSTDYFVWNIN